MPTLVFMSGAGTSSPILDFKSRYSLLNDDYRITVVEKFGYDDYETISKSIIGFLSSRKRQHMQDVC